VSKPNARSISESRINPANSGEFPVLMAIQGILENKKWEIKEELIIGRENDCDIVIEDRQVSRHHARLKNFGTYVEIEDLASKNGTYHQGVLIKRKELLEDGDTIQIALVQKFTFYTSDATMPMEDFDVSQLGGTHRIKLDVKSRRVWVKGEELVPPLSAPQFRLLTELSKQRGRVIPRNELITLVWVDEFTEGISEQALDALIRRLRTRLAEVDPSRNYIRTIRGHGLQLED
jgi:pSer/pThr/pTyr-binding forkhead associated (FHA) protein